MASVTLLTPRRFFGVIACIFLASLPFFYFSTKIPKFSLRFVPKPIGEGNISHYPQSFLPSKEDMPVNQNVQSNKTVSEYINTLGFTLNHESLCENGNGSPPDLLIVVTTAVPHFEKRQVLRNTWGGFARSKGAKLIFLLGSTKKGTDQRKVIEENKLEKDIVQAQFLDTYRNLTLKSVAMVKWVAEHCSRVKFLLKLDDDVVVNIDALLKFLKSRNNVTMTIYGHIVFKAKPFRSGTKWRVTKEEYPLDYYPTYVSGGSYLLTGDTAIPLYKESLRHKYFFFEDVFLTGIVAQEVAVKRASTKGMILSRNKLTVCTFHDMMMSYGHEPKTITKLWSDIKINKTNCTS